MDRYISLSCFCAQDSCCFHKIRLRWERYNFPVCCSQFSICPSMEVRVQQNTCKPYEANLKGQQTKQAQSAI